MSIHVKEYGDKSASLMVFIHGGGVSGWMWEKQISHFQSFHFETYYKESCRMSAGTLYRILKENMSFKLPARFSEASADILVTVGEKERGILKTSAREIDNKNANCRSVMIPGTGHGAPLAQPELFNEMVE
ncbi:alpha/beta fold hydrolase [Bacillus atrophaeus]|uniref:alpha/beta fold hydrolase n=1 Tax=Bacillus atrophaeus TaxID=1452 RepID=UPI0040417927